MKLLGPENLYSYQIDAINHILKYPRSALWIFMGGGKTVSTLTALEKLSSVEEVYPALIIAPLRVANSVWTEEPAKWSHLKHLTIVPITGDLSSRKKALEIKSKIYVTNFEQIEWLVNLYGKRWPFKFIIVDESSRLRGFRIRQGTKRSKELYKVSFHPYCNRMVQLSGTPAPSGLQSLYGQIHFLDQGERLGRTFTSFEQRWFRKGFDGFSLEPLPHAQKEIEEKLSDICLSIRTEDYFDLEAPIITKIMIDLPPGARKHYNQMEKEMFMELEGHGIEAFNAASKTQKLLQICSGANYLDPEAKKWGEVHDEKIRALESIIEEAAGMPVLVAYHFRSDLERLCRAFPAGRALDKNPQTIKDWNKGKIPILFAHPASAGHGIDLALASNILVFFSVNWNLEEHLQIIERIGPARQMQHNLKRSVYLYYILARNSMDEIVLERLQSKKSVQDLLLEALRARK